MVSSLIDTSPALTITGLQGLLGSLYADHPLPSGRPGPSLAGISKNNSFLPPGRRACQQLNKYNFYGVINTWRDKLLSQLFRLSLLLSEMLAQEEQPYFLAESW